MKRFVTTVIMIFISLYAAGNVMGSEKKALILVEYQNEWLSTDGKLNKMIEDLASIDNSIRALEYAREIGMEVIHVTMNPDINSRIFRKAEYGLRAHIRENKLFQGKMKEIHPDFFPKTGECVIKKRIGASAFTGTSLNDYLRKKKINSLYIMGYALHVCVESTLRDAYDLGYDATVLLDASSAFTSEQKIFFEENILDIFGQGITTDEFVNVH